MCEVGGVSVKVLNVCLEEYVGGDGNAREVQVRGYVESISVLPGGGLGGDVLVAGNMQMGEASQENRVFGELGLVDLWPVMRGREPGDTVPGVHSSSGNPARPDRIFLSPVCQIVTEAIALMSPSSVSKPVLPLGPPVMPPRTTMIAAATANLEATGAPLSTHMGIMALFKVGARPTVVEAKAAPAPAPAAPAPAPVPAQVPAPVPNFQHRAPVAGSMTARPAPTHPNQYQYQYQYQYPQQQHPQQQQHPHPHPHPHHPYPYQHPMTARDSRQVAGPGAYTKRPQHYQEQPQRLHHPQQQQQQLRMMMAATPRMPPPLLPIEAMATPFTPVTPALTPHAHLVMLVGGRPSAPVVLREDQLVSRDVSANASVERPRPFRRVARKERSSVNRSPAPAAAAEADEGEFKDFRGPSPVLGISSRYLMGQRKSAGEPGESKRISQGGARLAEASSGD